jgi:hypothetical protein
MQRINIESNLANVNNTFLEAFSVLEDGTAGITSHEQVPICVRYTKSERPIFFICKEDFF